MRGREKYSGLSSADADVLLKTFGTNEIKTQKKNSPLKILFRQIRTNYVIYLLLAALIISFVVGKTETSYTIACVIIIVITVGFVQEYKAERAIDALKSMITQTTTVIRDGNEKEIPTTLLVPEDIIVLRTGDKIPADSLLLEGSDLKVNESILTGESVEVRKEADLKTQDNPAPNNMISAGTFVTSGKCAAKVLHTGMNTKFGKIAGMISTAEKELPLQIKLNKVIKYMVICGTTLSVLAGIIMLLHSEAITSELFLEILVVVLALSIASFPEGFPVVFISTLAFGVHKMAQKNAIVNRMSIIETLGETTVICSDKTGTITTGKMTVRKIVVDNKFIEVTGVGNEGIGDFVSDNKKIDPANSATLSKILHASILCNDARIEKVQDHEYNVFGSSTEGSLLIMAAKAGVYDSDIKHDRVHEIPFSSERKMMATVIKEGKSTSVYVKGAPEMILKRSKHIMINGKKTVLTKKILSGIHDKINSMTSSSYRVMAIAFKDHKAAKYDNIEKDLIFLGVVGMEDPPRPEIAQALKTCQTAGIKVKMITGDGKDTSVAISKEIGLAGKMLSGEEIDGLSDDELFKVVNDTTIFYRVRPEHKLRIVKALKANGEIVTMTGDGVNDAPALKEAHIGVAMGINGTDVSRESADLILKDDHFSTIVDAVREGRTIFSNIQKFSVYQISINIAQVFLILMSVSLNLPLPLIAIQILFMNIISDEITAITLSFNTYSNDAMNQPPRRKSEIITKHLLAFLLFAGITMSLMVVGTYYVLLNFVHMELEVARTTVFVMMNMFALANAFNFRSFRKLVITRSLFVNKYLFGAAILSLLATITITYTGLNKTFELIPIGINEWMIAIATALIFMLLTDLFKFINNRYRCIDKLTCEESVQH